jgi:hypothetical protein
MLFKTLAYFDNTNARAAQVLGIATKTLYNRLNSYQAAPIASPSLDDTGETAPPEDHDGERA